MGMPLFTKLILGGSVTLALVIGELVLSHYTHSISLLVVTNQSMYNLLTLGVSASAIAIGNSNAESLVKKANYGWSRMEVVGSLSSLVFLGSLCFGTAIEALQTISHTGHLDLMHQPVNVFILAFLHIIVWLLVLVLIGGYTHYQKQCIGYYVSSKEKVYGGGHEGEDEVEASKDHRTPYLKELHFTDVFRDLASCILLMVTTMLVYFMDEEKFPNAIKYIDPCIALLSIVLIVCCSIPLGEKLASILFLSIPNQVSVKALTEAIMTDHGDDVLGLHEFHVWSLDQVEVVGTVHILYKDEQSFLRSHRSIQDLLTSRGVSKLTIQPEFCSCSNVSIASPTSTASEAVEAIESTTSEEETEGGKTGDAKTEFLLSDIKMAEQNSCRLSCKADWCEGKQCCQRR